MDKKIVKANLDVLVTKIISGLNVNVLKYLLPLWILPVVAVNIRVVFGAIVFWIISFFFPQESISRKDKIKLFLLGVFLIYGYLFFLQMGVSKTTPVSSSIFISLQPIWVFLIGVIAFKERIAMLKVFGILMGFGGALLCILTQQNSDLANDPKLGNILCLTGSLVYAFYLIIEKSFIQKGISPLNILKYTFTGSALTGIIVSFFTGLDIPFLHSNNPTPWILFAYVLIFPTIIGYLLIPMGLKYLKTTVVAIYGYVSLLVVAVVSFVLGQDRFSWSLLVAVALICASVYFVEIAERKK